jgi:hypothetical protein
MIFNFKVGALENQLKFKTRRGPHVTHLAPSYCMHWSPPSFHTLRAHPASPVPTALPVTVVTSRRRRHRPMCAPPYPRRCPYPPPLAPAAAPCEAKLTFSLSLLPSPRSVPLRSSAAPLRQVLPSSRRASSHRSSCALETTPSCVILKHSVMKPSSKQLTPSTFLHREDLTVDSHLQPPSDPASTATSSTPTPRHSPTQPPVPLTFGLHYCHRFPIARALSAWGALSGEISSSLTTKIISLHHRRALATFPRRFRCRQARAGWATAASIMASPLFWLWAASLSMPAPILCLLCGPVY